MTEGLRVLAKPSRSATALALVGLLAPASGALADQDVTRSPKGDKSVVVTVGEGVRAVYRWPGGTRSVLGDIPFNGAPEVRWLDDEVAEVSGSCGSGCSATVFASSKGVLGPYPGVLAADARAGVFVDYEDPQSAIRIYALNRPVKPLAQIKPPSWCPRLECDSSSQLQPGVFTLSSGGHRLVMRYRLP